MSVSRPQLFPAALAAHSVESLYAMHGREHSWIYWLSLCGISAAIGALPLVSVELTVRSGGVVRPASERVELKAAVSGRIARVLVRDNDRVSAGQVLLELTARDAEERLSRNRELQHEKADVVADLVELTIKLVQPDHAISSIADLESVHVWLTTRLLIRGHAQFLTQLEACRLALGRARRLRERTAALSARGIVTDQERDEAIYAYDRAAADLQLLIQQTLAGWQSELRDEQTALGQLVSEQNRLKEELTLSTLRAPATGTLQGLNGLDAGSYVMGG
jgi:HlyD family secretion protein